jgi:hypothetical protein
MLIDYDGTILFGKVYKGQNLRDADSDYLEWVLLNVKRIDTRERDAIRTEIGIRIDRAKREANDYSRAHNRPDTPRVPAGVTPDIVIEVISAGRRALGKRYHPDAGGDHEKMVQINAAADFLETQARQLQGANK